MSPLQPPGVILLIPSAREFDRGLRRGIVDYANTHGPWIFYDEAPGYLRTLTPRQRLKSMREWNAAGAVVLQSRLPEVARLRLSVVVAVETRRLAPTVAQVFGANLETGRMGAEALLALGLRHFAFCGLQGLEFSDNRCLGFVEALRERGYSADIYTPPSKDPLRSWYEERKHLARWLMALPTPVGLMACNDDRARMAMEICRANGIRIPDDIAVLGVDNDEQVCRTANPPLSSIAIGTEKAGYEAAALLDTMMKSGRSRPAQAIRVMPLHVVSRRSTDILAVDDPALIRALRLIREGTGMNLRVSDLLAAAGLSRRTLQDRFRQYLSRSPLEEIHRCRAEQIARLLVDTNMSIGTIATAVGFESEAHLARFFSRRKGLTPLAFRRKAR